MTEKHPSAADLAKLASLDTCTVANAIECFLVRLRNEGFVSGAVKCWFPDLPPMVGYAATARIRTAYPPMTHRCYYDRMDFWTYLASVPGPRVMVLEDMDHQPGIGAFVGELHGAIGQALDCVGCVTNGAVRDLPALKALGFRLFAGSVAVSHSYAHIIEFGEPVEIGGLKIRSGDLIHADRHGVQTVPLDLASQIPARAAEILAEETELIKFCASPKFSLEELSKRLQSIAGSCDLPWRPR